MKTFCDDRNVNITNHLARVFNIFEDVILIQKLKKEMFLRVAKNHDSGRTIKRWFDEIGMTTRVKKKVTLSQIYQMLKNPFYYGEFEYPLKSGNWYRGKHPPLIKKGAFDKVQEQLVTCPKCPWGERLLLSKDFLDAELAKETQLVKIFIFPIDLSLLPKNLLK